MWEANTIQVPKALVKQVIQEDCTSDALLAFCLMQLYPNKSPKAIKTRFGIPSLDMGAAQEFVDSDDEEEERPRKRSQRKQQQQRNQSGSGERKQHPQSPPSPAKFKTWLREKIDEAIPDSFEVRDGVADAIYEKSGGDKQYILDAIETTRDYHENKQEVNSPGAVVLSQLSRFDADKLHSMAEAVRRGGTGVKDRSKRMSRAMERAEEYRRASGGGVNRDDEFYDDEDEDDDE